MRVVTRFIAGAVCVLALARPVFAGPPDPAIPLDPRPTAVVVRTDGGYSPSNRWLAYDADGIARFNGYSVNVRCGDRWRSFVTTDVAQDAPDAVQVRRAVRSLWQIAADLAWQPTLERDSPDVRTRY